MKKLFCTVCVLLLTLLPAGPVLAEVVPALPPMLPVGDITPIENGALYDLDGDGAADEVQLTLTDSYPDAYEEFDAFALSVNDQSVSNDMCCFLSEQLYALRLDEYGGTLLMVFDHGPSDDPCTHFFLYEDGLLMPAGTIAAHPDKMRVNGDIITAPVRGRVLYTWSHDADFSLARTVAYDMAGQPVTPEPAMYMIPRYLYPMGLIVTLNVDLPLCASMTNPRIVATLSKDSEVILCASDDVQWVYIEEKDGGESGWLKLDGEYGMSCLVSGEYLYAQEVFSGLIWAD